MWTPTTRQQHSRPVKRYQTDLTDAEWRAIAPHLPEPSATGRPREWPMREILNGIFYVVRAGCPWRLLPNDLPPWGTILKRAHQTIGDRLPIVHGVWADGSIEAAAIARRASSGGASALLVFPPAPFASGQSAEMVLAHFRRIADATDLPLIAFQYPLSTGQGYCRIVWY